MKNVTAVAFVAVLLCGLSVADSRPASNGVASMERKAKHVKDNGALPHPSHAPTEFTENEVNAYMASGHMKLPVGVQSVRFQGLPGVVTANARVDFDQIREGTSSFNPLLAVFSGTHDVVVVAHVHGSGGQAFVHIDSVSLDGIEIPNIVLQLFVEEYLTPKYPDVGMDSRFELPNRIDTAVVGEHKLTLIQK